MRVRLIIAALTGAVVGLVALAFIQARQLRAVRLLLEAAATPVTEIPGATNQRPLRLRLHSLPPIHLRTEVRPLDWRSIESPDYPTYIANLREIGCPEETIRDIILADVNKLYAARRRALSSPQLDWKFWLHPDEVPENDASAKAEQVFQEQRDALELERKRLIHTLLGESSIQAEFAEEVEEAMQDRDLRFLSPEKRQSMAEATTQWRRAHEVAAQSTDEAESLRLHQAADKALEDAVGKVLTSQEREEYELRSSPLANELRDRLRGFGASREEFEQLFKIEREFVETQSRLRDLQASGTDPQALEKQEAAAIEQEARIRELLGDKRYTDFERSNDPDYQTLFSLTKDHAMPTDLANQVWSMRGEVETQATRIRENPLLTAEQKMRALDAIRLETQAAIIDVLGEPLLDDYQRQGGGWIGELTDPADLGETGEEIFLPPLPAVSPELEPEIRTLPTP